MTTLVAEHAGLVTLHDAEQAVTGGYLSNKIVRLGHRLATQLAALMQRT